MKSLLCNLLVATLFVCLSVENASCLRCYECNNFDSTDSSKTDVFDESACQDVDSSMITLCPDSGEDSVCRILRGDKIMYGDVVTAIKRSCGKLQFENVKEFGRKGGNKYVFQEEVAVSSMVCNTDLCNGAVNIASTKMILFISTVVSLSFFMYVY